MNSVSPITAATTVQVLPEVAFEIFVDEIDRWWRPGPYFWNDPARAIGIRFERGVGGRWIECYDQLGDDVFVMGEITGWEPGVSMSLDYHTASEGDRTFPLEIQFVPDGEGTAVSLMHGGWEQLGSDAIEHRDRYVRGWEQVLEWFVAWATWGSPQRLPPVARQPYVLQPGAGVGGNGPEKATRRSTMGSLSITESVTTGGAPPHVHRYDDEAFYVLEGTMTVSFGGDTLTVPAGGFVFIPRGVTHAWDTIGEARLLIITAPGGLEEFLAGLHSWPTGYADAWAALGERYGYSLR